MSEQDEKQNKQVIINVDVKGLQKYLAKQKHSAFFDGTIERYEQRSEYRTGAYVLLDLIGGELSLCTIDKKVHPAPLTGRKTIYRHVMTIIESTSKVYGIPLNASSGWKVPKKYLIPSL